MCVYIYAEYLIWIEKRLRASRGWTRCGRWTEDAERKGVKRVCVYVYAEYLILI